MYKRRPLCRICDHIGFTAFSSQLKKIELYRHNLPKEVYIKSIQDPIPTPNSLATQNSSEEEKSISKTQPDNQTRHHIIGRIYDTNCFYNTRMSPLRNIIPLSEISNIPWVGPIFESKNHTEEDSMKKESDRYYLVRRLFGKNQTNKIRRERGTLLI